MSRSHWMFLATVVGVVLIWWVVMLEPGGEPDDLDPEPTAVLTPSEAPAAEPTAPNTVPAAPAEAPTEPPAAAKAETTAKPSAEPQPSPEVEVPVPPRSGPVDELKRTFEREPRASGGARFEAAIEAEFRRPEVPAGLLKSVMCRTSVCRIETRWSRERAEGFMGSLMRLVMDPSGGPSLFDGELAISPEADDAPDGSRAIEVYIKPATPNPPAGP